MTKATEHAKKRAQERLDPSLGRKKNGYFVRAYRDGKTPKYFKGEFHDFLMNKQTDGKIVVKVYDNNIFICKNKKVLTMYPIPEEFMPLKDWLKAQPQKRKKRIIIMPGELHEKIIRLLVEKSNSRYVKSYFDNFGWCAFVAIYKRGLTEEEYAKEISIPVEYIHNWHNTVKRKIKKLETQYKNRTKPLFNSDGSINEKVFNRPAPNGGRSTNMGITKEDKERLTAAYNKKMRKKNKPKEKYENFLQFILDNSRKKSFKEFFGINELKVLKYLIKDGFTMKKTSEKMNVSLYFVRKYKNNIEKIINENFNIFKTSDFFLGVKISVVSKNQDTNTNHVFTYTIDEKIINEVIKRKNEPYFIAYLGRLRYEVFLDIYEGKLTLGELNKKYRISNKYLKRIQTRAILKIEELLKKDDGPFGKNYVKGSIPEGYHIQDEEYAENQLRAMREASKK